MAVLVFRRVAWARIVLIVSASVAAGLSLIGTAVGGFALVEVRSQEEAIELAKRFRKIVGDGESEIRQVFG